MATDHHGIPPFGYSTANFMSSIKAQDEVNSAHPHDKREAYFGGEKTEAALVVKGLLETQAAAGVAKLDNASLLMLQVVADGAVGVIVINGFINAPGQV